jgi:class 3 adenylate cyclase
MPEFTETNASVVPGVRSQSEQGRVSRLERHELRLTSEIGEDLLSRFSVATTSSWAPVPRATSNLKPRAGNSGLVTVLFVDVVGSTEIAARLGDRQWRDLLSRFYEVARKAFVARNGREIENPGDGFLVVFDEATPPWRQHLRFVRPCASSRLKCGRAFTPASASG